MNTIISDFREVLTAEIPYELLKQVSASVMDDEKGDFYVKYHNQWYVKVRASKWVKSDGPSSGHLEIYKKGETVLRGRVETNKRFI